MGNVSCQMRKSSLEQKKKNVADFPNSYFLEDILMFEKRLDKCI